MNGSRGWSLAAALFCLALLAACGKGDDKKPASQVAARVNSEEITVHQVNNVLARNPNLAVRTTKNMLANYPDSSRVFAISKPMERFNDPNGAEHVTSGNSATPYRDELFGPEFAMSVFISEPVHNLVHREVLVEEGVSFHSKRAEGEEQSEFPGHSD